MHSLKPHILMFFGMFLISLLMTPIMINSLADYRLSLNQLYMASFMSFAMVLLEATMHPMPVAAWLVTVIGLVFSIIAYRSQWLVGDREYLNDMIPHHSMAVLTSRTRMERTVDRRIKQVAETILNAQVKEIALMKLLTS
jgi:hypothetical protein